MRGSHPNQLKSNLCAFLSILSILLSILSPPLCQAVPADWKTEKWQGFSVSMPPDWNVGDTTYTQASWNFGDTENGKYGFFGIFKSRVQPRQMPMEKGASLVPQGSVMIDGQPATDYDITFSTGDRRHHLICLDQPDFEGNYLFLMAGVVGMDFQSHWPTLTNVMETVKYNPSPPPEPPLDPSLATKTRMYNQALANKIEVHPDCVDETKHLMFPINGYAPGTYYCKCWKCTRDFVGDKWAVCCRKCAGAVDNHPYLIEGLKVRTEFVCEKDGHDGYSVKCHYTKQCDCKRYAIISIEQLKDHLTSLQKLADNQKDLDPKIKDILSKNFDKLL